MKEKWPGGYVRNGVYVIERMIDGQRWHKSTHVTNLRSAMKHLERFESDPSSYTPRGLAAGDPVRLDEKLIDEFFEWHLTTKVSREWALNVRSLLFDWGDHLINRDLRHLSLTADLKPHLKGLGQRHHRVKAIRLLFGWLREECGKITRAQDVTLDLAIPVIAPRNNSASKAVPFESVQAVLPHLGDEMRDVVHVLSATGWHVNELRRFAEGGSQRDRQPTDPKQVVSVIGTVHKRGRRHFTALLHREHADAAARILERKHIPNPHQTREAMVSACDAAKVPVFQLGQFRSSVTTWLVRAGVPLADVSRYVGHASTATTQRFYIDHEQASVALQKRKLRVVK